MIATVLTLIAAVAAFAVTKASVDELARRAAVQATNHRGLPIAATGGVAVVLGLAVAGGIASLARTGIDLNQIDQLIVVSGISGLVVVAGAFAFLGLYDDIAGGPDERGWKSHLAAVRKGRASPGAIKLIGGASLGLIFSAGGTLVDVVVTGAIIALSANLVNAFDAKPLRAIKVTWAWILGLLVTGAVLAVPPAIGGCVVLGAVVAALWTPERQERIMLGDSGSNALGAALGALTVATETHSGTASTGAPRIAILVVLLILTGLSHRPGFGSIIDRVGILRRFDRLGRQPDPLRGEVAD